MVDIYVCSVRGSRDDFITAHSDEAACKADLVRWAKENWYEAKDGPTPENEDELIRRTYDDIGIDWWIIGPIELNAPCEPALSPQPKNLGPSDPERFRAKHERMKRLTIKGNPQFQPR